MNRRTLKLIAAITVLGTVFALLTKDSWYPWLHERWASGSKHVSELAPPPITPPDEDVGKVFVVKRVQVLKGDQFDVVLDNDSRILARLKVRAVENSKAKVVDLFNSCENPTVRLLKKEEDGQWLVDFQFKQGGKDVDLASWLSDNKLVYK